MAVLRAGRGRMAAGGVRSIVWLTEDLEDAVVARHCLHQDAAGSRARDEQQQQQQQQPHEVGCNNCFILCLSLRFRDANCVVFSACFVR